MKVFARIDQYKGDVDFRHWVSKVALHTCYDKLRSARLRPELRYADLSPQQAEFLESTLATSPTAESTPDGGVARDLVNQLLATLKPNEQLVLRLLDLEQKSVGD